MFTVTPIGSCRITTPLKMGQARHGLNLNLARNYGYCHSPATGRLDAPAGGPAGYGEINDWMQDRDEQA